VAALGTLATGCGGIIGSCTETGGAPSSAACVEYEQHPSPASSLQQVCTGGGGTWSTNPCTDANRVGRCRVSFSLLGVNSKIVYNFYTPATQSDAQAFCNSQNGVLGQTATFFQ
jgi:hypothetical protein